MISLIHTGPPGCFGEFLMLFFRPLLEAHNPSGPRHGGPLVQTKNANFLWGDLSTFENSHRNALLHAARGARRRRKFTIFLYLEGSRSP